MNTPRLPSLRALSLLVLLLGCLVAWPAVASADVVDTLADLLAKLDAVNANPLPISGGDVAASKSLFTCLNSASSDTAVIACVEQSKNTALGQKAIAAGGIPSWFWDLVDLYVALRTNDFWGVVSNVGEAGLCIVAQIMAAGAVDVCGLIQELVDLANDVLDAGKAIGKFFQSLGEAAWEGLKSVGCSLGFGGCGKSSPPEQVAYAWVFQPKIVDGLAGREAVDAAKYGAVRQQLVNDALAKPAVLHVAVPSTFHLQFTKGQVDWAAALWDQVVDAQWSKDVGQKALPALAKMRGQYDNPQQIALAAADAAAAYKQHKTPPAGRVETRCAADFSQTFGFAHVDRWIFQHAAEAQKLGNPPTNLAWCTTTFWAKNKDKFAQQFHNALTSDCPAFGTGLLCPTLAKYETCVGLMSSVGAQGQCGANLANVGKEAAEKIAAAFKSGGSKIPCSIQPGAGSFSSKPADFVCSRPPQRHACEQFYKQFFGTAPLKLVNCVAKPDKDPQYATLMKQVAAAATSLASTSGTTLAVDPIDPLGVHPLDQQQWAKLKESEKNDFGFGPPSGKPGFDFLIVFAVPSSIDGFSTPTIVWGGKGLKPPIQGVKLDSIKEKVYGSKPGPDPALRSPGALKWSTTPAAPAIQGPLQQPSLGGAKVKSGSAPPGVSGPVPARSAPAQASPPAVARLAGPELTSGATVRIGGQTVAWGGVLNLAAAAAHRRADGLCEFEVRHVVRNAAATPTVFARQWTGGATAGRQAVDTVAAGGSLERADLVVLKPGTNELQLTLSRTGAPAAREEAGHFRVQVNVSGSCVAGASRGATPLAVPRR